MSTMRQALRAAATMAVILSLMLSTGWQQADAARGWCKVDPVIMVDGQLADVFVGSTPDMLLKATGPIKMEIYIPVGSKGSVILTDLGFLKGYSIKFIESSSLKRTKGHTQVQIRVYAPSKGSLPVTVTFAPRTLNSSLKDILFGTSVDGVSNSWITLKTG